MKEKLEVIIKESNLPVEEQNTIKSGFEGYESTIKDWESKVKAIVVTDETQTDLILEAKEARRFLRNKRLEIEDNRKKLKEQSLRKGQAIDAIAKYLTSLIQPLEEHLELQEKYIVLKEKARLDELESKRKEELGQYVENLAIYNLRIMTEEEYQALLATNKEVFERRQEEARKAEEARIAEEKRQELCKERYTKLTDLGMERDIFTGIISYDHEIQVKISDVENASEEEFQNIYDSMKQKISDRRAELEKLRKQAEAQRLEAEKARKEALEKVRIEREKQEALLKKEREEKAKLEAELKAQKDAEEKRLRDEKEAKEKAEREEREAKERAEKEEAERQRKLKAAPDKDKLKTLAANILNIEYPEMQSDDGKNIINGVKELMKKVNIYIINNVEKI